MLEELKTILNTLKTGVSGEETYLNNLNKFLRLSGDTKKVASDGNGFACVFYSLLVYGRDVYSDWINDSYDFPENVKGFLIASFKNIKNISIDNCSNSFVKVIWFLKEICNSENQKFKEISKDVIHLAPILLDVLGKIEYIFYFKDEQGNEVFPIHRIIGHFLESPNFFNPDVITLDRIQVLQLAVKLFKTNEQGKQILDRIRKDCNLRFIDYLLEDCTIVDTKEFCNYMKNHTLIFFNQVESKVLIHNEKKNYFEKTQDEKYVIEVETDCNEIEIGYFVEIAYQNIKSTSFSDLMRNNNEEERVKLLSLLFNDGYYNIFLQYSLYKDDKGNILPLNPFCANDEYIIQEIKSDNGAFYNKENIIEALNEYRLCSVKTSGLNRLSFGLVALLCTINLGSIYETLSSLNSASWFQSQVIEKWICSPLVSLEDIKQLVSKWYIQLKDCKFVNSIGKIEISVQDFFPLRFDSFGCLYKKLIAGDIGSISLQRGRIVKNEESDEPEKIICERNMEFLFCDVVKKCNEDELHLLVHGSEVFILFSDENRVAYLCDQRILKTIDSINSFQKNLLSYDIGRFMTNKNYDSIVSSMELFIDSFNEVTEKGKFCCFDFDSHAYLRIIYNMVWTQIEDRESLKKYVHVLNCQPKINYSEVQNEWKKLVKKGLLVPKDRVCKDSVLSDVYNKYLKTHMEREKSPLYDNQISINGGFYCYNGEKISSIVLLTDNFLSGSATIMAIRAYLGLHKDLNEKGLSRYKQAVESMQKFSCENNQVSVSEILETNKDCFFSVIGLFGTDEGCKKIDSFLEMQNIRHNKTDYLKKIDMCSDKIKSSANAIWGKKEGYQKMNSNEYPVIREFSMPKKTLFPSEMIDDPNKAICLFVKKDEL